jgi:ABC-type phosphate transport system permease subunit
LTIIAKISAQKIHFDKSCQNGTIPLHCQTNKNKGAMMDILISAVEILAKLAVVVVMLGSCAAIYIKDSAKGEAQ